MKVFCLIFSLYALTLALTPCADGFCAGDKGHLKSVAHEDEKAEDLCSSFCICACCGYSVVELAISFRPVTFCPILVQPDSCYKTPCINDLSIDFWQPPKIG